MSPLRWRLLDGHSSRNRRLLHGPGATYFRGILGRDAAGEPGQCCRADGCAHEIRTSGEMMPRHTGRLGIDPRDIRHHGSISPEAFSLAKTFAVGAFSHIAFCSLVPAVRTLRPGPVAPRPHFAVANATLVIPASVQMFSTLIMFLYAPASSPRMTTACSEFSCTRFLSNSASSGPVSVRRFTTTLPSALTLTTTSPIGAVFSRAAEAFGTLTSSSFSVLAAFHVNKKKMSSSRSTSTRGAS